MKTFMKWTATLLLVVGGLVAVLWPVENWRMYDANWMPLAMTEAEAYCSGVVISTTGSLSNEQKPAEFAACIAEGVWPNDAPRIALAVTRFCEGIAKNIAFPVEDCVQQVEAYDIWPLLDGGYTWEWNTSNARPQVVQSDLSKAPRREGRDDESRNSDGRLGD